MQDECRGPPRGWGAGGEGPMSKWSRTPLFIYWAKVLHVTDHPKIHDNCFVVKYIETNFGTLNENTVWHQSCASAEPGVLRAVCACVYT